MSILTRLLLPLVPLAALVIAVWRKVTGQEPAVAERLGRLPEPHGPSVWVHGASNGELASVRWVVEALIAARPGLNVLVTSNTATAREMVAGWGLPGVTAAFAPLDLRSVMTRLLQTWWPKALITVEGEIYPRRFAACAKAGIPVILIGARMSERSFRGWKGLQPVMSKALSAVRMASAQDHASETRLLALGLSPAALRGRCDLKHTANRRLPVPELRPRAERSDRLLAASTHEGEDAIVLDAFEAARDQFRQLILAPRHPRRSDDVAALVAARGLSIARRSKGAMPGDEAVFLADTMGEMDQWYALCGACFVGASFVKRGGHTPWEPVRFGCAILHGPHVENFSTPYAILDAAGGAVALKDPSEFAAALRALDIARQDQMAEAAARSVAQSGDSARLVDDILSVSAA